MVPVAVLLTKLETFSSSATKCSIHEVLVEERLLCRAYNISRGGIGFREQPFSAWDLMLCLDIRF